MNAGARVRSEVCRPGGGDGAPLAVSVRRREAIAAGLLVGVALAVRCVGALLLQVDTDEPQHLHVVWGWLHGFVQYRDLFDNHAPLFHLLLAPVLGIVGEHPGSLAALRIALTPVALAEAAAMGWLGSRLFSPRVGLWGAVFSLALPPQVLATLQFRPDGLWTLFWLAALATGLGGPAGRWRSFATGLLLGAALGTSVKTAFMLAALGLAGGLTWLGYADRLTLRASVQRALPHAIAGGMGGLVIPVALACVFGSQHALGPLVRDTVSYNLLPGLGAWGDAPLRPWLFPLSLPLVWLATRLAIAGASSRAVAASRCFLVSAWLFYAAVLYCGSPLVQAESLQPVLPLAGLFAAALLVGELPGPRRLVAWLRGHASPVICAAAFQLLLLVLSPGFRSSGMREYEALVTEVLRLTGPEDTVADLKGETSFRPRGFAYVLEKVTRTRLRRGLLPDDVPEQLVRHRTTVAIPDDGRFPPRARAFLSRNFVSVGDLRVAGRYLESDAEPGGEIHFELEIPADYRVVSPQGPVVGWIDGLPNSTPRELAAGPHVFRPDPTQPAGAPLAVVWAPAVERGFSPFLDAPATDSTIAGR